MNRELAIIVPVYNVEKYLHECIDSILKQTFTDFDLVLVDDGSTDNSGRICDSYIDVDARIHVIHKSNGGVSSARNAALDYVRGGGYAWLTFIDSDDFISSNYIENLLILTKTHELNFIHAGYTNYDDDSSNESIEQEYAPIVSEDKTFLLEKVRGLLPSKLFSSMLIKKIGLRFDENIRIAEDMIFTIEYIRHVDRYAFCSEVGYYYRRHRNSLTRSHKQGYLESLACFDHFYKAISEYKKTYSIDFSEVRDKQLARSVLHNAFALYSNNYPRKDRLIRLSSDFSNQKLTLLKNGSIGLINNILASLLLHKQYILFDVITSFLFSIKTKLQTIIYVTQKTYKKK